MFILRAVKQQLIVLAFSVFPLTAMATVYTVTSNADTNTAGTLRYAINQLNASGTSGSAATNNTINFNAGLGQITLTSSLPVITRGVSIVAPSAGQTISGNLLYGVFRTFNSSLSLTYVTVTQGLALGGAGNNGGGGGLGAGGAVYIDGTLTLGNTAFNNCTAQGGAGAVLVARCGSGMALSYATGRAGCGSVLCRHDRGRRGGWARLDPRRDCPTAGAHGRSDPGPETTSVLCAVGWL